MSTVISIENVSKSYQLGAINTGTFYGDLNRWWARQRGLPDPHLKIGETDHGNRDGETLWALKDVNFQIQQGEALGIIGRNGAGKSTLLKILSRVTAPTSGEVKVKGRIASLLEVGTGFHPELTGRENIYLNGAIMGMNKSEISRKFDEIVDFSGVEKFIDTPVKRYSSGMYVRLAFAVAAHLDPEILVVDEVLAVGDAEFQKKCLGKMSDVASGGRTVLFVSHNMGAISQLCPDCILLDQGKLADFGQSDKVIRSYLDLGGAGSEKQSSIDLTNYNFRQGTQEVNFEWAQIQDSEQKPRRQFSMGEDITIVFAMKSAGKYTGQRVKVSVMIRTSEGINICNMVNTDSGFDLEHLRETETLSICMKDIRLYPGLYYTSIWVGDMVSTPIDWVQDCLSFEIIGSGKLTTRDLPRQAGLLFLTPEWSMLDEQNMSLWGR